MVYVSDSKDWNYLYRSVAVKSLSCQKPLQLNKEMKVGTFKDRAVQGVVQDLSPEVMQMARVYSAVWGCAHSIGLL